ncbi:MAG TPA: hypothetical protein VHE11_10255 [Steroidobacteraceae bacterium]|nr:hypothetical protein [Steroidobacteraceae bacterium]
MAVCRPESRARGCEPLGNPLEEAILRLRHVQSAAIVAVAALRRQNCELDEDIATLLQRCVCDSLDEQLQKLEAARHLPFARLRRV